ncbi:hypothetical protein SAMN05216597_3007 [Pseudomonas cannabina]|nr:hypothetical protein SAMN05216597_3007 [Pseudomonas cannabina]
MWGCGDVGMQGYRDAGIWICGSGPGDASLVRELPGTGSNTSRLGARNTTEAASLGPASPLIAAVATPKLIQPFGQKPNQDVSQDLCIKRRGIS